MPKKSSRSPKRRRNRLTLAQDFALKSGNTGFDSEAERRAAWENHGAEIMETWRHPARRPWAWWKYEMNVDPPRKHDPRSPAATNNEALWLAEHGHLALWEIEHLYKRNRDSDGPALAALSK
jgi:hypothetical protein